MGKKKVIVYLNDTRHISKPSDSDIEHILIAADEIIDRAGRSMLVKILKGSRDKKLLIHGLEKCPSYGYYSHLKMDEISIIVDWMIWDKYLRITFNGRLPMIAYTNKGWETYKPILANELIGKMIFLDIFDSESLIEELRYVNREIVLLLLEIIISEDIQGVKEFLYLWESNAFKKVAKKVRYVIQKLEGKGALN